MVVTRCGELTAHRLSDPQPSLHRRRQPQEATIGIAGGRRADAGLQEYGLKFEAERLSSRRDAIVISDLQLV